MAAIHKMTLYFVDPDDEWTTGDILEQLHNLGGDCLPNVKLGSKESKNFEWTDDVIVNYTNAAPKEVEDFYNNL